MSDVEVKATIEAISRFIADNPQSASTAVLSECKKYRYRLTRKLDHPGLVYAFFGINPSTADERVDDQTVRKLIGFSNAWGAASFIVGNVFGYRATNVRELARCEDPVGPANKYLIDLILRDADVLVPCWGSRTKIPKTLWHHIDELQRKLLCCGKPLRVFGQTESGDPMHPLMLSYSTLLRDLAGSP